MRNVHRILNSAAALFLIVGSTWSTASFAAPEKQRIEPRNQVFQQNHPDQYETWKATSESEEITDALAEDPNMVVLWGGYGFSREYNKAP